MTIRAELRLIQATWLNNQSAIIKDAAFYQLKKTEFAVQDYKKIIIRDKKTNALYGGDAVRQALGLPK